MRLAALAFVLMACGPKGQVDEPPADAEWEVFEPAARLRLSTRDFRSNIRAHPRVPMYGLPVFSDCGPTLSLDLGEMWHGDADRSVLIDALRGGISLTSLASGPVDIEVRDGWVDLDGAAAQSPRGALSAVPKTPIADGWYVLKANIDDAVPLGLTVAALEGPHVENTLHARVYVGDAPHWYAVDVDCRTAPLLDPMPPTSSDGRTCFFSVRVTQWLDPAEHALHLADIQVLYDGQAPACEARAARPDGDDVLRIACEEPPDGTPATVLINAPNLLAPTGGAGGAVDVTLDQTTLRNIGGTDDPIWSHRAEPFAGLGL